MSVAPENPTIATRRRCQARIVSGFTRKIDQRSRPSTRASAVRIARSEVRSGVVASDGARPRVDDAGRGSRHPWNDRCDRAARAGRSRGGQDGRSGPPADPRSAQITPRIPARNPGQQGQTGFRHPQDVKSSTARHRLPAFTVGLDATPWSWRRAARRRGSRGAVGSRSGRVAALRRSTRRERV